MRNLKRGLLAAITLAGSLVAAATVLAPAAVGDPTPTSAFAIGNVNGVAGAPVTFWGAQWWKDNQISSGDAPAAFKGFVVDVNSTACTFTTTTGNSAPDPPALLPPVVTVLVASSIVQSGSTITGTISEFALVATNDGYGTNPGHAGTGTVIGFVPCGGTF